MEKEWNNIFPLSRREGRVETGETGGGFKLWNEMTKQEEWKQQQTYCEQEP